MDSSTGVASDAQFKRAVRKFSRRILAMSVLTACVFVGPAIASIAPAPLHKVRVPRIDSRLVKSLQRWADGDQEPRSEEI
jgi:hypothetical protein